MKNKYISICILSFCLFSFFFTFAEGEKVIIDAETKQILILSGDQKLDAKGLMTITSSEEMTGGTVDLDADYNEGGDQENIENSEQNLSVDEGKSSLNEELQDGTELEKAVYWMYKNGLTKYDTLTGYRPSDPLLREESAKIIGQLYLVLGYDKTIKNTECSFSDSSVFDPTLSSYIEETCSYGIFKGNRGMFYPHDSLSKAEALTVLIRILEGKLSEENFFPWWTVYFVKAKEISLTKELDVNSLGRSVTREEIALLVYRFKNIVLDNKLKSEAERQLSLINQNPDRYNIDGGGNALSGTDVSNNIEDFSEILSGVDFGTTTISVLNSPEVVEAINWMKDNGLTKSEDISSYQPFDYLTREQAAKMFVQFAKAMDFGALSGVSVSCDFSDLNEGNSSLLDNINQVCELGIMQGRDGKFFPNKFLTKAEFVTALIRLSEGQKLDENVSPWRTNYFLKAGELGILNVGDISSFESLLTRYEAALLFYRFQLKQKIFSGLNYESLKNELITTIKNSDGNFSSGDIEDSYAVTIDVNLLKNQFFHEGYVELLGIRYSLKKTDMTVFDLGDESFVWYGDIIDFSKDSKIGTINFVVSNGNVVQGTIRFNDKSNVWLLKPSNNTTALYNLIVG